MAKTIGFCFMAAFWVAVFVFSPLPAWLRLATVVIALGVVYAIGLIVTNDWACWRELL